MDKKTASDRVKHETTSERASDREMVVSRWVNGPARLVYAAWTQPELLLRWWVPKSLGMQFLSCEADVRVGGRYRFVFRHPAAEAPLAFFGRYLEVTPNARLVWTNEESGDAGPVSTATFEERAGQTLVVVRDLYPSKAALDDAIASGSAGGLSEEMFGQLEQLLAVLPAA